MFQKGGTFYLFGVNRPQFYTKRPIIVSKGGHRPDVPPLNPPLATCINAKLSPVITLSGINLSGISAIADACGRVGGILIITSDLYPIKL